MLTNFLYVLICILGVCIFLMFIRVVKGPTISDRLVGVSMIGTEGVAIIIILSVLLDEGWLLDVAIVYALLSFLAVVVLTGLLKKRRSDND